MGAQLSGWPCAGAQARAVLECRLSLSSGTHCVQDLIALVVQHGLIIVFATTLAARIGVPVPAAPLLVVAGGLAVGGALSLPALLAVAVVANVLGDAVWFAAGRRYGHRVLGLLCRISLSPDSCVRQSEALILRWGGSSLVAAKFVPGVSVVAAPMAGAVGMSVARFVGYDALGGAVWSLVFLGLGAVFSLQIQELLDALARAGAAATGLLVLGIAGFVLWRYLRRRRFRDAAAMPRITQAELHALIDEGAAPVILDVRSSAAAGLDVRHIPGARLVELSEVADHAPRLPRDREIVLYCNCPNEASAATAAQALRAAGLQRVRPLAGGLDGWAATGGAVAEGRPPPLSGL
ncbi:rhodanese-like domain-containing protein [Methylibium sp.]|uniref:rhodanese-like domain-containing protein n=1 Tax=Methylibium sp. TaxID=2067992 RepID=UPI003BAC82B2